MGAVAAIGGALIQGSAAKKAAKAQEAAANRDIAFQTETRDLIRGDLAPYRTGGYTAQQALDYELGLGSKPMIGGTAPQIETYSIPGMVSDPRHGSHNSDQGWNRNPYAGGMGPAGAPGATGARTGYRVNGKEFATLQEAQAYANANRTGGTEYGGYTKTPGYDFRLQQGQDSLQAGAAARGGLYSGAAMRDLLKYGQDYGSNEYGNYLSRLGARADTGMNAAQMSGQASQQAAAGVSNALGDLGNARAAGAIGVGQAINGGIQNSLGVWNYQRQMQASGMPGGINTGNNNWANPLFGGSGLGGFV